MASKEWTDDKTFSFRKDLLRIELGEMYFLWAIAFQRNE